MVEAEHATGLCEELLRSLPGPGEPRILWGLRRELGANDDLRVDDASQRGTGPWLVYLCTLQDDQRFWAEISKPVESALRRADGSVGHLWPTAKRAGSAADAAAAVLQGATAIVLGGEAEGTLLYSVARHPHRGIEQPTSEPVIVGPKEAFVEDLDTNLALMRGWLPHASLRIEIVHIGRRTKTRIAVLYLEDVVRPGLVKALLQGLYRIRTDAIRTDRQVAEYLTSGSLTPFPLSESSERVDSVAAAVAGGRAAIFVEHSPFPFLVPTTYFEFQKDSEAGLGGPLVAGFVRTMRHLGQLLAVTAPGLVVALLSANPGPLRTELAATLLVTRVGLPYPVFPEMFVMMLVVDIFSEATAQAPGGIGTALSIVGTLIIGQISVQARLVSELVMIVAAATSMGSFLALRYQFSYAIRIWKYVILGLSGVLGLFGWIAGIMFLVGHLASLKSAGLPYLAPLAPLNVRSFLWGAVTRPNHPQDTRRSPVWSPMDSARAKAVPPEPSGNETPGGPAS